MPGPHPAARAAQLLQRVIAEALQQEGHTATQAAIAGVVGEYRPDWHAYRTGQVVPSFDRVAGWLAQVRDRFGIVMTLQVSPSGVRAHIEVTAGP